MRLLDATRRRAPAVGVLAGLLALAGAWGLSRLQSSIFPSVTFPIVKVIAEVGEEPAAQVMPAVTRPLEEAILRVPGVERVRSITSRGSAELSASFRWGTDMRVALQRVEAEAQRLAPDLPARTRLDVEWMNPATFPILGYALTSPTISEAALLAHAEYVLKPALLRVPGIAQVQIQGGRRREFQVRLDPARLLGRGLAPADVVEAFRRSGEVLSAGLVEANHELYLALVGARIHDVAGVAALAVATPSGPPVRLGDLGAVAIADQVSYVRTSADGRPAVLVNVVRQPAGDTVGIARAVERLLRDEPALVPAGARWSCFYDQARFVADSIGGLRDAILVGVALAGLVLLAFLRRPRAALVAVLAIPLTVAIAGIGLVAAGQTVNLMTMAGIAASLGLVADDAIVVVEGIHRAAEDGAPDPAAAALAELWPAMVGSSLATIAVFVPFALLPGVVGAFFQPLALTVALALAVSLAVSLLLVPLAAGGAPAARPAPSGRLPLPARGSARIAAGLRRRPWVAAALLALLAGAALWFRARLGSDFLPAMDEGTIVIDYWSPPGTSLTDTDGILRAVERELQALPDVRAYSRRTGTQLGFFVTEPNRGDYLVDLKPRAARRPVDEIVDDLRARIAAVAPALHVDFGQLIEDGIGDLTGGAPQPIDLKLFGTDPALLAARARQVAAVAAGVRGVEDVFDGVVIAGPSLEIRPDRLAAARAGVPLDALHAAVEPWLLGTVAGQVRVGDQLLDLRVLAPRTGPLEEVPIRTASGAILPLSALASISARPPEAEIDRENLATYVGVTARLSGRDLGGAVAEIRQRLEAARLLGPGITLRMGGQFEQQQASFRALSLVLLGGLGLIGLVVLFTVGGWRAAAGTILVALAALAGSLGALLATGRSLDVSSYVGAIMMTGIAAENAIFVLHEERRARARGRRGEAAWAEATARRLRPVAMTVLAGSLALAPLALALGQGAQLMQPLAIAVIGGFALSGPLVLWVLPAIAGRREAADPQP